MRNTNIMNICIWENIASPHQRGFFENLYNHPDINLHIRYFEKFHQERKNLGWSDEKNLPPYELYVEQDVKTALQTLPEWKSFIHVIPGISYGFTKSLIDHLIEHNVMWIHWSERSGITLAKKLHYNVFLFKIFQPILCKLSKGSYAKKINKY